MLFAGVRPARPGAFAALLATAFSMAAVTSEAGSWGAAREAAAAAPGVTAAPS